MTPISKLVKFCFTRYEILKQMKIVVTVEANKFICINILIWELLLSYTENANFTERLPYCMNEFSLTGNKVVVCFLIVEDILTSLPWNEGTLSSRFIFLLVMYFLDFSETSSWMLLNGISKVLSASGTFWRQVFHHKVNESFPS